MEFDCVILGAGAAGLMCAGVAGGRTLVIDHARAPGEKIRISGGGRCNFTNLQAGPANFLSENPHFAKSALARYTQWDFLDLVNRHRIAWHEKTLGQLFCDGRSTQIIAMLMDEATRAGAEVWLRTSLADLSHDGGRFRLDLDRDGERLHVSTRALVLATGGKSIPKMGATGLAYDIARRFGLRVTDTRPALVPLTFPEGRFAPLAGVSVPVRVSAGEAAFEEAMLFTHRGLSGPAILQASSYWREGGAVSVNLDPGGQLAGALRSTRATGGRVALTTALAAHFPARLVDHIAGEFGLAGRLADQSDRRIDDLCAGLTDWRLTPAGSEGYRTAEVTLGGIATDGLSSQTMEARSVPGLFAIGEAVDVTGWLGGYNFQWAWSSGHAAGQAIRARLG